MIFWIIAGVIGLGLYFLNQNKSEKKGRTTITHKRVIQTPDGEVQIQRTQTIDSVRTSYSKQNVEQDIIKTINPKPINQLPQPQPVQQSLIIEPIINEQASFIFEDQPKNAKCCPNCERVLPYTSFRSSSKHGDGLTKWCGECLDMPRESKQSNKKHCPNCKRTRLKTSYYKNSKRDDGLTKWCKTCMDKSK